MFAAFAEMKPDDHEVIGGFNALKIKIGIWCDTLRKDSRFENFITLMILVVAVQIGVETDGHVIPGGTILG